MRTKYFNLQKLTALLLISVVGLSSCKKFLDINDNPNNPDTAAPSLLLPTVQAALGQIVGNNFQVIGGMWAQYWTQSATASQYRTVDQYSLTNATFDRPWLTLYRNALVNAQIIIDNKEVANSQYKGIAYLMKAYGFQVATDAFGDIPLSEALSGASISNPKYDSQAAVYDSIFVYIDRGVALLDVPNTSSAGLQDIVFQGNIARWKQFANTLKLRAYLRLSQVAPEKARTGIAAFMNAQTPFLAQDASIAYSTTGGNQNPLYNGILALGSVQNLVASGTAVKQMKANNDPRRFQLYTVISSAAGDSIGYLDQGAYNGNTSKVVSYPSALTGALASSAASATAPVKLMSHSEALFLQSEAVARGWATGSADARTLFVEGIRRSFVATGLTTAAADTYIASAPAAVFPADAQGRVKAILTQKYFAMNGVQGFEAWTEWRRTGYPDFLVVSKASTLGAGRMPLRFLYPSSEITSNANYPGTELAYTPVWWDK